jgi:hypothetical protein
VSGAVGRWVRQAKEGENEGEVALPAMHAGEAEDGASFLCMGEGGGGGGGGGSAMSLSTGELDEQGTLLTASATATTLTHDSTPNPDLYDRWLCHDAVRGRALTSAGLGPPPGHRCVRRPRPPRRAPLLAPSHAPTKPPHRPHSNPANPAGMHGMAWHGRLRSLSASSVVPANVDGGQSGLVSE